MKNTLGRHWLLTMLLITCLGHGMAYGQTGANYTLEWTILDAGGGQRTSVQYAVSHSIGRPTGGLIASNSHYTHTSGVYAGKLNPGPILPDPTPHPGVVPEPGTFLLLITGILGLWMLRRKRSQALKRLVAGCLLIMLFNINQAASAYVIEYIDSGQSMGNTRSQAVALGDLDNDGDLDAFIADWGANSVWLYDNLNYRFIDSTQRLGDVTSNDVMLADLDGDGDIDAFVANEAENIIWLNDGTGTFADSGQSLDTADSFSIALGDLDNDGDLDVFTGNTGANTVWLNDGVGTFTDSGQLLGDSNSNGIALGDIDNDGDLDAIVANTWKTSKIWLNDGHGIFSKSQHPLETASSLAVELADFDGDNDLDIFIANYFGEANTVWFNDGSGKFNKSPQTLGNSNSYGMTLGDVDNDGDIDAFIANSNENKIWFNIGKGFFIDSGLNLGNANSRNVFLEDIDGDGDLDAFVVNSNEGNTLWFNQGELILTITSQNLPNDLKNFFITHNIVYTPLFDSTRGDSAMKQTLGISRTYLLTPTASTDLEALRSSLDIRLDVETCIYNQALWFDDGPNDLLVSRQQNIEAIGLTAYWEKYSIPEPADIALAIIDKPVDVEHEDFAGNMAAAESRRDCTQLICTNGDSEEPGQCDAYDISTALPPGEFHGTHVAGIAVAATNNSIGIAGVAGNSASIMPLSVGSKEYAELDDVFRAIEFAVDSKTGVDDGGSSIPTYKAVVMNMSLSSPDLDLPGIERFYQWIRYAHQHGVPVITSMGNLNSEQSHYPAGFPETFAVGAVEIVNNDHYQRWIGEGEKDKMGSNFGNSIDLVAPGVNVVSTVPGNEYDMESGTSMAVPHVTGVVGVMLSKLIADAPEREITADTIEELRWIVQDTAIDGKGQPGEDLPGWDMYYGAGLLNADRALQTLDTETYVSIMPHALDFEDVPVGTPEAQTVTMSNPCTAPLLVDMRTLKIVQLQSDPEAPAPEAFLLSGGTQFSEDVRTIAPGESWQLEVEFLPMEPGARRAILGLPLSFFSCANANDEPGFTMLTIPIIVNGKDLAPIQSHLLTLQKAGAGDGQISINGLNCGEESCVMEFKAGAEIKLSAQTKEDSIFSGWEDGDIHSEPDYLVTMDADRTIIAHFEPLTPPDCTVTLVSAGDGEGTISHGETRCEDECQYVYPQGTELTVQAEAASNSEFEGWSLSDCAEGNPCTFILDSDLTLTATFIANIVPTPLPRFTLMIKKDGDGNGLVQGAGIGCGDLCTASYDAETIIQLTAEADLDSRFVKWSRPECEQNHECTVTMNADMTVTAEFETSAPIVTPVPTPGPAVPEPTTGILLGFGVLGMVLYLIRRHR